MPIYVYEVVGEGDPPERIEVFQKMSDAPLTKHPQTGQKLRRVIAAPSVPRAPSPQSTQKMLSDKNLDRLGFTKYVKTKDGYEKRTGKGPDTLARPEQ
jgi:hypothetical protein